MKDVTTGVPKFHGTLSDTIDYVSLIKRDANAVVTQVNEYGEEKTTKEKVKTMLRNRKIGNK